MDNSRNEKFDNWHQIQGIDENANTPWYNYVKSKLSEISLNDANILEIGCGRGDFTFWINKNSQITFNSYTAADFSKKAIEIANKKASSLNISKINYVVEDIQKISFEDDTFTHIVSCETIEHVPNPRRALKELYRVCSKNGILLLTTPNYMGFFGLYRIFLRLTGRKWTEVGQPINNFMLLPLTLFWVKNAGFKILEFKSDIISTPYFGKRIKHFNWKKPKWFFKWFGLQSYIVAIK